MPFTSFRSMERGMIPLPGEKLFFVMMAGLSCSGKSTLAEALGKVTGWPVISKDLYKSSLIKCGSGLTDEETGRIAYELLFDQAEAFLVRQKLPVVFDTSAHFPFILENAQRISTSADAELKIIHCFAPTAIRRERLKERVAANSHQPFMLSTATMTIEDEPEYFRHLSTDRLSLDTLKPVEICLAESLRYIRQSDRVLDI